MREAIMRLAGRTLTMVNAARFRATLLPLQFGVGSLVELSK